MKALILSDVHSNIHALNAIWELEQDSDAVYCAGDLVDAGPNPNEVIRWMRDRQAVCVRGNHDRMVIAAYRRQGQAARRSGASAWPQVNAQMLSAEEIGYLESLPETIAFRLDGIEYVMQHAYRDSYDTIRTEDEFDRFWSERTPACPANGAGRRIIFGHTHYQGVYLLADDKLWLNPGSCAYRANKTRGDGYTPAEPGKEAHYMTIVDGRIAFKKAPYDLSPLIGDTKRTGMDPAALYLLAE